MGFIERRNGKYRARSRDPLGGQRSKVVRAQGRSRSRSESG